jgi:hypothetical protein
MQLKIFVALGLSALVTLTACNDNSDKKSGSSTPSDSSNAGEKPAATNNSTVRANINVTIGGGDMNGSYSAECRDACCSWGIAGNNTFGNQYSETGKGDKELSSVQLVVANVKEGNTQSKNFTLTVGFGKLFEGKEFNIRTDGGKSEGSGTVDISYSGDKATVTIKGVSKEGSTIDLKMECNKVMNPNNIGQ